MARAREAYKYRLASVMEAVANQKLRLICGIDGCDSAWSGAYEDVLRERDDHRAQLHPAWVPPTSTRRRRAKTAA
jgi:hypothetical protein